MPAQTFDSGLTSDGGFSWPRGTAWLTNSLLNKGTVFTGREGDALGLRVLLPTRIFTLSEQVARVRFNLRRKESPRHNPASRRSPRGAPVRTLQGSIP
jgi:malate dehydrogenase (oxaloacetate-decarboxylating)(NADP+)